LISEKEIILLCVDYRKHLVWWEHYRKTGQNHLTIRQLFLLDLLRICVTYMKYLHIMANNIY